MSKIQVNEIVNHFDNGAPDCPKGFTVSSGISTFTGSIDANGSLDVDGHTNLDNVNISGVVTATSFVGNVTGNVTGNADSATTATTATNAQGLTGSPSISVASLVATGNVTIGGTLTYDDVTNVDSVGVVTARTGIVVSAGGLDLTGPYKENITAMGALDVDCSTGNYFTKTINGNSTFTFSNVPSGCAYSFTLELTHTSGTVSWPASVKFPSDTAPTLTTGKTHLFMFVTDDGGTRFRASSLVDYVD